MSLYSCSANSLGESFETFARNSTHNKSFKADAFGAALTPTLGVMTNVPKHVREDRLDAWYDGSAICVVAVGSHGDPLDLADHEVGEFIRKLEGCLAESQSRTTKGSEPSSSSIQSERAALVESWATTLRHLAACRFYLPERLSAEASLAAELELAHYLHHNELGLALAAAESLGNTLDPPPQFWRELELAATNMAMLDAAARYAARRDA